MSRIGVLAIASAETTARYFERAARADGHEVVTYVSAADCARDVALDWLLVVDPCLDDPGSLRHVRCPIAGYLIDVHQQLAPRLCYANYLDHVFVAQPDYLPDFRAQGHPSVHWLPLGCDPEIHFATGNARIHDVGFVGKLGKPGSDRFVTLQRVLAAFDTNDTQRPYTPKQMGETYSRSRIVFNKSINRDLNMRFFEGLAAGALVVTDHIENGLGEFGRDGEHYVTYRDADEAIDKIRYYLAHDAERERIARCGQRLVHAQHTYLDRFRTIAGVTGTAGQLHAPVRNAAPAQEAMWRSSFLRTKGAGLREAATLLWEGRHSPPVIANAFVATARGVVRPMRNNLSSLLRSLR